MIGQFFPTTQHTHTRSSDGAPDPDGVLQKVVRDKTFMIRHYRQIYLSRPDPIVCMPVTVVVVDTSGRIYDDHSRLLC